MEELAESLGEFPYFPLHTQTVERAVKGTTEASTTSWSWHSRHNAIVVKQWRYAMEEGGEVW